ncbi:MAG TPA: ATP-dependent zinc metalloprotease FtsH [Candidatus Cloacimonadota bacterium]|nr:ATP-dependent zinc metalloprotease FtsH [Candidatus Cloacimonadota bacterium]HQB40811.1 ATP-dependent zinc metalloprotease FtsH [Candidatus Cloacimonadota bacterium]
MTNNNKKQIKKQMPGKKPPQTIFFWIVMILLAIVVYQMMNGSKTAVKDKSYSEFLSMVDRNEIKSVRINSQNLFFKDMSNNEYTTYMPFEDPSIVEKLHNANVQIESQKPSRFWAYVISWLPFILLIGIWIFLMRSMQGGGNKAFQFGKSKAKLFMHGKTKITFNDVAGVDEAKEELCEIVEYLKSPKKFQKLGGRIPRGVLLLGRPGTGKTLLAKAVAGEAKVPFFSISGSDFVEMFVGVGASRVRDLFEQAKRNAPCIAFIDEIDAVGRSRGAGLGGGHDEREQTLNQLLVEMDGFEQNDSVIIIAATNRPDVLDPALLRPGRFDRQVVVDLPDIKGRNDILKVHTKILPIADNVNLMVIARSTPGFSGADLENLANEAALGAARKNKKKIDMSDFDEARDKVTLGKERKNRIIEEDEKKSTAYHEIGHVLCSVFQDKTEPVHKVTIIPRGFTGGATHYLMTDKSSYSRSYLEQILVNLMGGRVAEEIVFNELTTGAGNDIQRATELAKKMVCNWGMSKEIGPMTVGREDKQVFLGRDMTQQDFFSEDTARLVDNEIRNLIHTSHQTATDIIASHKELMDILSNELLEKETLTVDEIFSIILANINEDEKDLINKKYDKAMEMKIDLSPKTDEPEVEPEPDEELDNEDEAEVDADNFDPEDNEENSDD